MVHAANLTRDLAAIRSDQITLHSQSVHLDLSQAQNSEAITFTSTSTLMLTSLASQIAIDLVGECTDVRVDGVSVPFHYADSLVHLTLSPDEQHSVSVTAECFYSRSGEGLHRLLDAGQTFLYTHCEPSDARRVFACFDQPDVKTSFTLSAVTPQGWKVRSNTPEASSHTTDGVTFTAFAATKPLPTYIVCLIAGPYSEYTDIYERDGVSIPLHVLCRPSMAEYLPTSDIFRWTKDGLAWCETQFAYPYPWGKYEQIFVPEYNIGATENPGLVTFNEAYLRRGTPSRSEREHLATTLLHEMAHMWFGDLVTMSWWDDLWLKESFADFIGTQAASEVSEFTEGWLSFRLGRKAWAFTADGLPTTHPIIANIPDVEAARANFDGITYAKGACALRQLAAYVGLDTFYEASRSYFKEHAFGSAGLHDWLNALEAASGRDMHEWAQAWLHSPGTDTLRLEADGIHRLEPTPASRPHRLQITTFDDALWSNPSTRWLDITDDFTPYPHGGVALLDTDGWSFAIIEPNAPTTHALLEGLANLPEVSWRASAWEQLWQSVRAARLTPEDFLRAMRHLITESEPVVVATVTAQAQLVVNHYLPSGPAQEAWRDELWALARRGYDQSHGDVRRAWHKAIIAASTAVGAVQDVHKLLDGIGFLDADQDERWALLLNLAARGEMAQDDLTRERGLDSSTRAHSSALAVMAAENTAEAKSRAFTSLGDVTLSNEDVAGIVRGLAHPLSVSAARHLPYFASLEPWWGSRTQVIASRMARGLFACNDDVSATYEWLDNHEDAPASLRRIVSEEADVASRAARVRAISDGSTPTAQSAR